MKRKDVVLFFSMCCYITLVLSGICIYFATDGYCDENEVACIQQNSVIETNLMSNYSERIYF